MSRNLSIPFQGILRTLREIRNGNFDKRVQVVSNDEIGYTGDAINEMIKGLIEREKIQQSLDWSESSTDSSSTKHAEDRRFRHRRQKRVLR